jgi:hypothetical protein
MLRQILSAIQHDDNPRLHHIPFLLWWIMSYGLGWNAIYLSEQFGYARRFCDFTDKIEYTASYWLCDRLFIGFIFGVILALIQSLLLRARYGYVPRFWFIATIVGATFAGYAYPSVVDVVSGTNQERFFNNFLLWFSILGLFQSIGLWHTSRKAWLMFVMGSIASGMTVIAMFNPHIFPFNAKADLVFGTLIQALGTGLLMLYALAHPREGSIPKRETGQGIKSQPRDKLATWHFIVLWICVYYFAEFMAYVVPELWYLVRWYTPADLYHSIRPYNSIIVFGIIGLVVAIAQHWLMKNQSGRSIHYWYPFTIVGWMIAGLAARQQFNFEADYIRLQENFFLGASIALPLLFQAIPLNRAMRGGWLWAVVGILFGVLVVQFQNLDWFDYMRLLYNTIFSGLFISLATACLFLWLTARNQESVETEN